ncbi:MAG: MCE family protein [Mycobacteriaceae bacterium]
MKFLINNWIKNLTTKKLGFIGLAALCGALAAVSYIVVPKITSVEIIAEFSNTTGLYVGDDVRVMGVKVGSVLEIKPEGTHSRVRLSVDKSQSIPLDAKAVIIPESCVSARFIQLAPTYNGGDKLSDGDVIPLTHTAVPVEWDQIKDELSRVAVALGPDSNAITSDNGTLPKDRGPIGDLLTSAAKNLEGEGQSLHRTIETLKTTMKAFSEGSGDLASIVENLQLFVDALSASGQQIVSFNTRMASVTSILNSNKSSISDALVNLDSALTDVQEFVQNNRSAVVSSLTKLSAVVSVLAQQRDGLAQILHVGPTALSNLQNIYQPAQNAIVSSLALGNFSNPANFICSALAAAEQVDAQRGSQLCSEYLGPLLNLLATDILPIVVNPSRGVGALPEQIAYSEPQLKPENSPISQRNFDSLMLPGTVG